MTALVTVEEAAGHLRIDLETDGGSPTVYTDERLADLQLKMSQASEIVLDYLKYDGSGWTSETVPDVVKAAILLVLTALWDDRDGSGSGDYLKENGPVARLLRRRRDPAIA